MKKTLLEVAHEIATDLHEAGAIDIEKMREHESLCAPPACKLSHVPNGVAIRTPSKLPKMANQFS